MHAYCCQSHKHNINTLCKDIIEDYDNICIIDNIIEHILMDGRYANESYLFCNRTSLFDANPFSFWKLDLGINVSKDKILEIKSIKKLLTAFKISINNIYNAIFDRLSINALTAEERVNIKKIEVGKLYQVNNFTKNVEEVISEPFIVIPYTTKVNTYPKEKFEQMELPLVIKPYYISLIKEYAKFNVPILFFPFSNRVMTITRIHTFPNISNRYIDHDYIFDIRKYDSDYSEDKLRELCQDMAFCAHQKSIDNINVKEVCPPDYKIELESKPIINDVKLANIYNSNIIMFHFNQHKSKTIYCKQSFFKLVDKVGDFDNELIYNDNNKVELLKLDKPSISIRNVNVSELMSEDAHLTREIAFTKHYREMSCFMNYIKEYTTKFMSTMFDIETDDELFKKLIEIFKNRTSVNDIMVNCGISTSNTYVFTLQIKYNVENSKYITACKNPKYTISVPLVTFNGSSDRLSIFSNCVSSLSSFVNKLFDNYIALTDDEFPNKYRQTCYNKFEEHYCNKIKELVNNFIKDVTLINLMKRNRKKFKNLCMANKKIVNVERMLMIANPEKDNDYI